MRIPSYFKKHKYIVSITILVLVALISIIAGNGREKTVVATDQPTKKVTLVSVTSFRQGNDLISANGIVESRGQADLKSQTSAPVAIINGAIGDNIYIGQTIIELQNTDIRAQLEQAKASLALAKGQYSIGGSSLDSARSGAIDKIRDSYIKGYDVVSTQIDPLLYNGDGNGSRLSASIIDSKINNDIIDVRIDLMTILRDWKTMVDSLSANSSTETLVSAIRTSSKNLIIIDGLLGNISQALNDSAKYATPNFLASLNTWKGIVSGARATVSGASQALTGSEASLVSANASYGMTAPAQISSAEAGVNNLEAQLAKTIIRSPINGKIAALPLDIGELASPGQLLVTVVGDGGLEVKAYASGEDISRIKAGAVVKIGNIAKGTVKSVAPSVSSTNRKVEVVIDLNDSSGLTIGQNVQVSIVADKINGIQVGTSTDQNNPYTLPIQNVKIVPGDAFVYTVDENFKIKKNPVILGEVKGDFIEVKGGITDDMKIVSPVYELDEGEKVVTE